MPKKYSTGGKARLLGVSKRGNTYLRKVVMHGTRATVLRSKEIDRRLDGSARE